MPASIETEETINVGVKVLVESISRVNDYGVMFEDDGETGYFYAFELGADDYNILDAMHIYNVVSVVDRKKPSLLQVAWSEDGLKVALIINGSPHAIVDFEIKRGYCRTNFPSPDRSWTSFTHEWSDAAFDPFC